MGDPCCTVVVAGGGASGVLAATHLLGGSGRKPVRVVLVDRGPHPRRGLAYSTLNPSHLLNVPAAGMSAFPDQPHHFLDWARTRVDGAGPHSFLPRRLYGEYLGAVLTSAAASSGHRLESVSAEVTAVFPRPAEGHALVGLSDGAHVRADHVVLALGNFAPRNPFVRSPGFYSSRRYVRDPWASGALDGVAGSAPVMLVGTGLTAIDVALSLQDSGQTGVIHAVSRHGLAPLAHSRGRCGGAVPWSSPAPRSARALLRLVREEVRSHQALGGDWREVVDGLRPATRGLWVALPLEERRRFLKWLARYWEVHRHRMAPEVAERVTGLVEAGRLVIHAGRIASYSPAYNGVDVRLAGPATVALRVSKVVNCTGAHGDVTAAGERLLDLLLVTGAARPHALGLGLDVTDDGAIVDTLGEPSPFLFALGGLCRGAWWETTAVPEIRVQAAQLAAHLLSDAPWAGPRTARPPGEPGRVRTEVEAS